MSREKKEYQPIITLRISPSIMEELNHLAAAQKSNKSVIARQLLEEAIISRVDARHESAYERLEQRLQKAETRFAALLVKAIRIAGQGTYLQMIDLGIGQTQLDDKKLAQHWSDSKTFAGALLKNKTEDF